MKALFYGQTDTGRVRPGNEDAFVLQTLGNESHILCVVIDGLGGYEGGEVAAEIAADTIKTYLMENREGKFLDLLKLAVVTANNAIVAAKDGNAKLSQMGCVLTAGIFDLDTRQLNVVHIGDTRLYRISQGEITKLTHDHSVVGYMEEKRELTEEEAMNHPYRNVIDRFLGETARNVDDTQFMDSAIFPISQGETLLFCSDGLYDMLTSAEILDSVTGDCRQTVERLIEHANDKGGRDNITVITVGIHGETPSRQQGGNGEETPKERGWSGEAEFHAGEVAVADEQGAPVLANSPSRPCMPSCLWLTCLLVGLIAGYALGNWSMRPSVKELTDSLAAKSLLADSLMKNYSLVQPKDSLSCDTLAKDSLAFDDRNALNGAHVNKSNQRETVQ